MSLNFKVRRALHRVLTTANPEHRARIVLRYWAAGTILWCQCIQEGDDAFASRPLTKKGGLCWTGYEVTAIGISENLLDHTPWCLSCRVIGTCSRIAVSSHLTDAGPRHPVTPVRHRCGSRERLPPRSPTSGRGQRVYTTHNTQWRRISTVAHQAYPPGDTGLSGTVWTPDARR